VKWIPFEVAGVEVWASSLVPYDRGRRRERGPAMKTFSDPEEAWSALLTDVADRKSGVRLLTKAAYAREVGVSRQAITRFVRDWGLPAHGPRGLIDADELDGLYVPRIDAGQPQANRLLTAARRPGGA
jgi:hypothetical protein